MLSGETCEAAVWPDDDGYDSGDMEECGRPATGRRGDPSGEFPGEWPVCHLHGGATGLCSCGHYPGEHFQQPQDHGACGAEAIGVTPPAACPCPGWTPA